MSITSSTIGKRTYKIVLLGDSSTGKTSIIERFVNNKFQERDNPTIGIDFLGKNVSHNATTCRLQLWDTAGQQRYRSLIPSYLKDAVGAIFVFDLSRSQTLQNLQAWIDLFKDNRGEKTVMVMCGNKTDLLKDKNSGFENSIKDVCEKNKMKCFQTSALSGQNVEKMFLSLIDDITLLQQARRKKNQEEDIDFHAPLTVDNLKSVRGKTETVDTQKQEEEENLKIASTQKNGRKFCC